MSEEIKPQIYDGYADQLTEGTTLRDPGDLTDQTFNRWYVVSFAYKNKYGKFWNCDCACGQTLSRAVSGKNLKSGMSQSCGCLRDERRGTKQMVHEMTLTPTYKQWQNMKSRCNNPNVRAYKNYGGRGIRICERWNHPNGFLDFQVDMGEKPGPAYTLDRKDNDGNYSCGQCGECVRNGWVMNCRWVTRADQNRNKRNSDKYTFQGVTKTLTEWCHEYGINPGTAWGRIYKLGWDFLRAITFPVQDQEIPIEAFGEKLTPAEWSEKNGIPAKVIWERHARLGWKPEEAVSIPFGALKQKQRTAERFSFKGEQKTLREISEALGIKPDRFYTARNQGRDVQALVDGLLAGPIPGRAPEGQKIEAFGKSLTVQEWQKEIGVLAKTIQRRLRNGCSPEEALRTDKNRHRGGPELFSFRGEMLPLKEIADRLNTYVVQFYQAKSLSGDPGAIQCLIDFLSNQDLAKRSAEPTG